MSKIGVSLLVLCSAHGLTPFSPRAASVVTRGAAGARCSIRSVAPRALDNDRDNDSNDAALVADDAEASSLPEFMRAFDAWGLGLKARAYAARDGAGLAPDGTRALALRCKFAGLLALFIVYRAYRGFFVVLPAVFGAVRDRVREGWVEVEEAATADVDPSTGEILAPARAGAETRLSGGRGMKLSLRIPPKKLASLSILDLFSTPPSPVLGGWSSSQAS